MSATYRSVQAGTDQADPESAAVLHALAGVPEAQGMGVIVILDGDVHPLRNPTPPGTQWLVVELRAAAATPPPPQPHEHASSEWTDLGMNCGGLVLNAAGTAGTVALAPETGGLSFGGTVYMASQTLVAFGQCSVSVWRVWNMYQGHEDINQAMDNSRLYNAVMYAADAYALLDVAKSGAEAIRYARDFEEAEVSFSRMFWGQLNRHERLKLTEALHLQGVRRVAAARLALHARTQITQAVATALAVSASARSGLLHAAGHQVYIWAIDSDAAQQEPNSTGSAGAQPRSVAFPSVGLP